MARVRGENLLAEDVDPDVLPFAQRKRHRQHEMRSRQRVADFVGPHRRRAEKVAREDFVRGREDERNDEQGSEHADAARQPLDRADQRVHDTSESESWKRAGE